MAQIFIAGCLFSERECTWLSLNDHLLIRVLLQAVRKTLYNYRVRSREDCDILALHKDTMYIHGRSSLLKKNCALASVIELRAMNIVSTVPS